MGPKSRNDVLSRSINRNRKNHLKAFRATFVVGSGFVVLIALLIISIIQLQKLTRSTNDAWERYAENAVMLSLASSNLNRAIGYGGFIHNFKNYILRRNEFYYDLSLANLAQAKNALQVLEDIVVDADLRRELGVIASTVQRYENKLQEAHVSYEMRDIHALDELVRVDDKPAMAALATLSDHASILLDVRKTEAAYSSDQTESAIYAGFILSFILSLIGVIAVWFTRWTEQETHRKLVMSEQLEAFFDGNPDALLVVDESGVVQQVNPCALDLFGYAALDDMIGLPAERLVADTSKERYLQIRQDFSNNPVAIAVSGDRPVDGVRKDGSIIPLDIALNQIPGYEQPFVLVACRDITKLKETTDKLKEALRAAEELGEAKTRFLATMSHELRTPLNAINGFSHLLTQEHEIDNATRQEYAGFIADSGNHLLNLVNDILEFSKFGEGPIAIENKSIRMASLVQDLEAMFENAAREKDIEFGLVLDSAVPETINSDETRIRQVLYNLVGNAVKFTAVGSVKIFITLAKQCKKTDNYTLRFKVIDTGPGIDTANIKDIFNPFTQADSSISRTHGGTGLGLAISRQLARAMGGNVRVRSELGHGSTFIYDVQVTREQTEDIKREIARVA